MNPDGRAYLLLVIVITILETNMAPEDILPSANGNSSSNDSNPKFSLCFESVLGEYHSPLPELPGPFGGSFFTRAVHINIHAYIYIYVWVFPKKGVGPQNGWFIYSGKPY